MKNKLILYDADCLVCNRFIDFVIKNDKRNDYYIIDNSKETISFLHNFDIKVKDVDSIRVIDDNKILYYSDAVIDIVSNVKYKRFSYFKCIPRFLRNGLYKLFARNRKYFQKSACNLPLEKDLSKILSVKNDREKFEKILGNGSKAFQKNSI
ncbi:MULTISPECIES: thiol-disulfide oxidoreductase DCC family protein [Mammaliicoccus]|uniref:thiol-disulfide oxidoreductase DCC family protein n=1 Tax=Mammaliicoccus TaxID=2803850 RepID=UPI000D1C5084|nr:MULTISPECIES: DCC1-like thiol-disulfide oxidoreductase family protein [Mammaliicoccus]MBO3063082.1 DUF393 domain-containing protein [Mammaliicoccus fleurettii]PTE33574.1 hypothetical protein BUY94_06640 [Mammaliicoccus fleurettii]RIL49351.1 DUF393 domain-containing protein [Mammaliicoccus fleurettii]